MFTGRVGAVGGEEGEGEVGVTDCDDLHCSALVRLSPRYRYTTCLHHSATTLPSASLPHRNKQQSTWSLTHSNQIISQGSAVKSIVRARNAFNIREISEFGQEWQEILSQ